MLDVYFIFACIVLGVGMLLLRDYVLPDQFGRDSPVIQAIAAGYATGDQAYTNTAMVYAALGLANSPTFAAALGYGLAMVPLLLVWRERRSVPLNWTSRVIILAAVVLSAVYLGTYSKDVLVIPVVITLLLVPRIRFGTALVFASALGYGMVFRQYWILVALLFLVFLPAAKRARGWKLLLWGAVAASGLSLAVALYTGLEADVFRDRMNEYRTIDDARTMIVPFLSSAGIMPGVVNNILTYFMLIIPIPVLLLGTFYHLFAGLLVLLIWYGFFWVRGAEPEGHVHDRRYIWCVALVMALLVTQAVFEPDYGSALRHLTPLLPLVLFVSWTDSRPSEVPR